jgi:MoxR-like ATPase
LVEKLKIMSLQFSSDVEAVDFLREKYTLLKDEIAKVIVGQQSVVEEVVVALFSNGHSLLVGVPGLAKTLLVNTVGQLLGLQTNRIQFTPDLMPSDIIGTEILNEARQFKFVKGPVFTNFLLADEINRTPPKTQSALLQAMQEYNVTASGIKYELPKPFFVLATQNPIEQEGTYPLPEAQLDRFMFNIVVDYPSYEEEVEIVKKTTVGETIELQPILTSEEIVFFQKLIQKVPVNDNLMRYAVEVVAKTRPDTTQEDIVKEYVQWGVGPRASQYLIIGAKTHAVLHGKYAPDIEDVKAVAYPILRHRIVRNYKAEADKISADTIIGKLL